ncbi:MAG TPA: L-glutamate gamma-semialdehyde dehydrogenase [Candidatus Dormibacteraeota bacterium]|jgi:1-pyrroline-5-carboxylate dehydrogenase|nr:L-glutamate gamma-semialdehyde dehydrogenase [Candidatus Dormibacteraeota bacterium]
MADSHVRIPSPHNEPVRAYAPHTAERESVKARLAELTDARTQVPLRIDGGRVDTRERVSLRAPHRHELVIAEAAVAKPSHVGIAIEAALRARADWAAAPYADRAAVLLRAANLLAGPWRDVVNGATMLGQSKTVHQAEIDAAAELIDFWRFNAHFGDFILDQQPISDPTAWNRLEYRPLEGFVFAVSPFNFTSIAGNLPTAPALMGNTVVFKPSRETMLVCHVLLDLLEAAGLPPGVINMISGDSAAIGTQVLDHPDLAGIHFTGSTSVFQWMWQRVGANVAKYRTYPRLVGETGGKDFVVAHPSADVEALKTALVRGAFEYQGQKCSAASRAYVPASMWKRLRDDMVDTVEDIKVGDVADFHNFMGAVINEGAFKKHKAAIAAAKAATNARVVAGGVTDGREGWFVRPTVIETDDPNFKTMREELFGPILTVYPYPDREFEKTLDIVDTSTPYGLTGAIFATDREAVRTATNRLVNAAGNFYVNDKPTGAVVGQQPFGGARASGTNDKAGSFMNLLRWTSMRTVKETYVPPTDYRYPYMAEE